MDLRSPVAVPDERRGALARLRLALPAPRAISNGHAGELELEPNQFGRTHPAYFLFQA